VLLGKFRIGDTPQRRRSVPNYNSPSKRKQREFHSPYRSALRKLGTLLLPGRLLLGVMLMGLVLLLSACQTLPPAPCEKLTIPTVPALQLVRPSQTYSKGVAISFEQWQKMLIDGKATPD
jgi:hypothetical protein